MSYSKPATIPKKPALPEKIDISINKIDKQRKTAYEQIHKDNANNTSLRDGIPVDKTKK